MASQQWAVSNVTAQGDVRIMLGDTHTTYLYSRRKDLWFTNPQHEKTRIENAGGGLLSNVHDWVFDETKTRFRRWLMEDSAPLLWINDNSGKGKTMLLCSIINKLQSAMDANPSNAGVLAFSFCQDSITHQANNSTAVLRGLIYMLTSRRESLLQHVRRELSRADIQLFGDPSTWDSLRNIFVNILRDLNEDRGATYLLIDALDQCEAGKERDELLALIVEESLRPESRIKWLLTSRRQVGVETFLSRVQNEKRLIELNLEQYPAEVSEAVNAYIDRSIFELVGTRDRHSQELCIQLREKMREKAGGSFLFVDLVVERLTGKRPSELLPILDQTGVGIPEFYRQAAKRIRYLAPTEKAICLHLLSFAIIASRPLRNGELYGLLSDTDIEAITQAITNCSPFFVTGSDTLQLIHKSAKDFLCSGEEPNLFPDGFGPYHENLFRMSLIQIREVLQPDMCNLGDPGYFLPTAEAPSNEQLIAAEYACVSWIKHLLASGTPYGCSKHYGYLVDFLKKRYLYWLESLSLLNQLQGGLSLWGELVHFLQQHHDQNPETAELIELAEDAHRFMIQFGELIAAYPLQAYSSALIFAPQRSKTRHNFDKRKPRWVETFTHTEKNWNPCICTLTPESKVAGPVALSPNSTLLASVHLNGKRSGKQVKIWDLNTGLCRRTIDGGANWIAFSPGKGDYLAISNERNLKFWNLAVDGWGPTLGGLRVSSAAFSPNGTSLATGEDTCIRIWDWRNEICLRTLKMKELTRSISYSSDGGELASAHPSGICRWDSRTGEPISDWKPPAESGPDLLSFWQSPHGDMLAAASKSRLESWNLVSHKVFSRVELGEQSDPLRVAAFSPCGSHFAVSAKGVIRIRRMADENWFQTLTGYDRHVKSLAFSLDSNRLVTAGEQGLKVWDLTMTGRFQFPLAHPDKIRLVRISDQNRRIVSVSARTIKAWDTASGNCRWERNLESDVSGIAISPDGEGLVSIPNTDNYAALWNLSSPSSLNQDIMNYTIAACFSTDGSHIALVTQTGDGAELWEVEISKAREISGSWLYEHPQNGLQNETTTTFASVIFSPDGKRLATSFSNAIQIWDRKEKIWLGETRGTATARALCFSVNNTHLAASYDDGIEILDLEDLSYIRKRKVDTGGKRIDVVRFEQGITQLLTNVGLFAIAESQPRTAQTSQHAMKLTPQGYGVDLTSGWITWGYRKVLKIPSDYQPQQVAVGVSEQRTGSIVETLAFSCRLGQLVIFHFPTREPPPGLSTTLLESKVLGENKMNGGVVDSFMSATRLNGVSNVSVDVGMIKPATTNRTSVADVTPSGVAEDGAAPNDIPMNIGDARKTGNSGASTVAPPSRAIRCNESIGKSPEKKGERLANRRAVRERRLNGGKEQIQPANHSKEHRQRSEGQKLAPRPTPKATAKAKPHQSAQSLGLNGRQSDPKGNATVHVSQDSVSLSLPRRNMDTGAYAYGLEEDGDDALPKLRWWQRYFLCNC